MFFSHADNPLLFSYPSLSSASPRRHSFLFLLPAHEKKTQMTFPTACALGNDFLFCCALIEAWLLSARHSYPLVCSCLVSLLKMRLSLIFVSRDLFFPLLLGFTHSQIKHLFNLVLVMMTFVKEKKESKMKVAKHPIQNFKCKLISYEKCYLNEV